MQAIVDGSSDYRVHSAVLSAAFPCHGSTINMLRDVRRDRLDQIMIDLSCAIVVFARVAVDTHLMSHCLVDHSADPFLRLTPRSFDF